MTADSVAKQSEFAYGMGADACPLSRLAKLRAARDQFGRGDVQPWGGRCGRDRHTLRRNGNNANWLSYPPPDQFGLRRCAAEAWLRPPHSAR